MFHNDLLVFLGPFLDVIFSALIVKHAVLAPLIEFFRCLRSTKFRRDKLSRRFLVHLPLVHFGIQVPCKVEVCRQVVLIFLNSRLLLHCRDRAQNFHAYSASSRFANRCFFQSLYCWSFHLLVPCMLRLRRKVKVLDS